MTHKIILPDRIKQATLPRERAPRMAPQDPSTLRYRQAQARDYRAEYRAKLAAAHVDRAIGLETRAPDAIMLGPWPEPPGWVVKAPLRVYLGRR